MESSTLIEVVNVKIDMVTCNNYISNVKGNSIFTIF